MGYGLFVGKSTQLKDKPVLVASISLNEHKILSRLAKHSDNEFLDALCNLFQDQQFSTATLTEANTALLKRLPTYAADHDAKEEYLLLCRLLAAINYALLHNFSLFGVAD
jgi:hypothetical protein